MKALLVVASLLALALPSKASGYGHFSIGASTGTNLVVLSTVPQTFQGIAVSSAAANDLFKCWDSTSTSGLTIASAATLGGVMYQTASGSVNGPAAVSVAANNGVVCGKSSTSSEALFYTAAP